MISIAIFSYLPVFLLNGKYYGDAIFRIFIYIISIVINVRKKLLDQIKKLKFGGIIMNNKMHFTKVWRFISGAIFNNTEYAYDRNGFHDNYDVTDTTELRLISSRRTFL